MSLDDCAYLQKPNRAPPDFRGIVMGHESGVVYLVQSLHCRPLRTDAGAVPDLLLISISGYRLFTGFKSFLVFHGRRLSAAEICRAGPASWTYLIGEVSAYLFFCLQARFS
jgi:hypothetical protein